VILLTYGIKVVSECSHHPNDFIQGILDLTLAPSKLLNKHSIIKSHAAHSLKLSLYGHALLRFFGGLILESLYLMFPPPDLILSLDNLLLLGPDVIRLFKE
jgi:hypothetical protein